MLCTKEHCNRGTDKLRICGFYALKIVRYSFFSKTCKTKMQFFRTTNILICLCLHSVSACFRTFCKFSPKPLPLTAYQECKPVQSLARHLRKQHPYLRPCLYIIYSALFHFFGYGPYIINGTMSVLSNCK